METIEVPFEVEVAIRLKRAAAEEGVAVQELIASVTEQFMQDREALAASATPEQDAAMARAVADIEAGRLSAHDEVFARLDAKHGW